MEYIENNLRKPINARSALMILTSLVVILALGLASLSAQKSFSEVKKSSLVDQQEMLAAAVSASLQDDLLNSNFFLAAGRLKSILSDSHSRAFCVRIIDPRRAEDIVLETGDAQICRNSELRPLQKPVFYTANHGEQAFSVQVFGDVAKLNFDPSFGLIVSIISAATVPIVFIFFVLAVLMVFVEKVFALLKAKDGTFKSDWFDFINEFKALKELIRQRDQEKLKLEQLKGEKKMIFALGQQAAQVAHDIRAPIVAINRVIAGLSDLPEEKRNVVSNATKRMNQIANGLLTARQDKSLSKLIGPNDEADVTSMLTVADPTRLHNPSQIVSELIAEVRLRCEEFPSLELNFEDHNTENTLIAVRSMELKRALSNLISNAIEALVNFEGIVNVRVKTKNFGALAEVVIEVEDNGKGIPSTVMDKIGTQGFSHGKDVNGSGSGLGCYHAKRTIEEAGGRFQIESWEGRGTKIQLILPGVQRGVVAQYPYFDWVLVDDDPLVHATWSLAAKDANKTFIGFHSADELFLHLKAFNCDQLIFLDSNLGDKVKGQDIAKDLFEKGFKNLYLATGEPKENYLKVPWFLDILGKEPPLDFN